MIVSAQSAAFYDGSALHVWYGSQIVPFSDQDAIFYLKTNDFVHWSTPVQVISVLAPNGIRDPTFLVEKNNVYLFCQCNFGGWNTIRLYRIPIDADFTLAGNYTLVGNALTSSPGFDAGMCASPTVRKIGTQYYLVYEAASGGGVQTIGKAVTSDLETVPYVKQGPLLNADGQPLTELYPYLPIVPDTYFNDRVLYYHVYSVLYPPWLEHWNTSVVYHPTGDFSQTSGFQFYLDPRTTRARVIDPRSAAGVAWPDWVGIAKIGVIGGYFYFLIQGWNTGGVWPWPSPANYPNLYLMRTPLHIVYPRHRSDRHTLKLSRKPY